VPSVETKTSPAREGWISRHFRLLALLWPIYVLELLGGMGIILLGLVDVAVEQALRPLVEQPFPELRDPVSPNLAQ